jgi:hypothetical protein
MLSDGQVCRRRPIEAGRVGADPAAANEAYDRLDGPLAVGAVPPQSERVAVLPGLLDEHPVRDPTSSRAADPDRRTEVDCRPRFEPDRPIPEKKASAASPLRGSGERPEARRPAGPSSALGAPTILGHAGDTERPARRDVFGTPGHSYVPLVSEVSLGSEQPLGARECSQRTDCGRNQSVSRAHDLHLAYSFGSQPSGRVSRGRGVGG